jgi:conjugative coupling factor TraD (SXT/TOL subfamily)
VASGLKSTFEYDKTYFDKIVASGLPLLEKLISGRIAELISPAYDDPDDNRPVFSWNQVIRQKKVVYVGLDALQDMAIAGTVGNTMFADMVSTAGEIYKHGTELGFHNQDRSSGSSVPINIHADEVNELMGEEFLPMLNKGGGAGLQITAYTQTGSDIIVKLGDQAKAGQAMGNFGTVVIFRVKEMATAEYFTEQLPMVEVAAATEVTGSADSVDLDSGVDFTSSAQDRITFTEAPLLAPASIMNLPKGQAFVLTGGGQLWKVRVPLADSKNDLYMTSNFEEMARDMEETYRTSETWWEE